jgi:hypothetical protein
MSDKQDLLYSYIYVRLCGLGDGNEDFVSEYPLNDLHWKKYRNTTLKWTLSEWIIRK